MPSKKTSTTKKPAEEKSTDSQGLANQNHAVPQSDTQQPDTHITDNANPSSTEDKNELDPTTDQSNQPLSTEGLEPTAPAGPTEQQPEPPVSKAGQAYPWLVGATYQYDQPSSTLSVFTPNGGTYDKYIYSGQQECDLIISLLDAVGVPGNTSHQG